MQRRLVQVLNRSRHLLINCRLWVVMVEEYRQILHQTRSVQVA